MPVKTTKVAGRRELNFTSLDEVLADADRLSSGRVKVLGNWSPGQVGWTAVLAPVGAIFHSQGRQPLERKCLLIRNQHAPEGRRIWATIGAAPLRGD